MRLFGGLDVRRGSQPAVPFRRARDAAVCAYLAAHLDQWHAREALVDVWWSDIPLAAGLRHLSTALSHLRQALDQPDLPVGEVLLSEPRRLRFNPRYVVTDLAQFETALRELDAASGRELPLSRLGLALDLYRGPLLADSYEEWVAGPRERLAQAHRRAQLVLGEHWLGQGDLVRALALARQVELEDPLDEGAVRLSMRALIAQHQAAQAATVYDQLARRLGKELGLAPDHETQRLAAEAKQAMGQQPALAYAPVFSDPGRDSKVRQVAEAHADSEASPPPRTRPWPAPLDEFIGREEELDRLLGLVGRPTSRLVTITGPGGAGKTRLAVELGRRMQAAAAQVPPTNGRRPTNGQATLGQVVGLVSDQSTAPTRPQPVFVSLEQVQHAEGLLTAAVLALGLTPDATPPHERLVDIALQRPMLLVLDNLEPLLPEASDLIARLLRDAPGLTCLVTSRRRVGLRGEFELPLAPFPVPKDLRDLTALADWPSVQLFCARAKAADPSFALGDHVHAVAELCAELDGLPLALELAAARVNLYSPAEMVRRLGECRSWLRGDEVDRPARHRTLEAALDWSFGQLAPNLRRLLATLSVFHGSFTLWAVEAICCAADVEPVAGLASTGTAEAVHDQVEALRSASLLQAVDDSNDRSRRFRLLSMVRDYASRQLTADEATRLAGTHALWFSSLVTGDLEDAPDSGLDWRLRIDAELDNVRAALRWLLSAPEQRTSAIALAVALMPYWEHRGLLTEAAAALEPLVSSLPHPSITGAMTARLYEAAGTLAFYLGRTADAKDRFAAAASAFAACEAWTGYARVLGEQAIVARAEGRYPQARGLYHQALELQRRHGDPTTVAKTLYDLGYLEFGTGETARAATYFEESLGALHRAGRAAVGGRPARWGASALDGEIAKVGLGLGMVRLETSNLAEAERLIAESLATFRRSNEPARQAEAELCLGHVRRRQGDHEAARLLYLACLDRRLQIGERTSIPQVLGALAMAEKALQRPERAVILLAAAAALRHRVGTTASPSETDAEAAVIRRLRGQLGEAAFGSAWALGSTMTSAAAAALARSEGEAVGVTNLSLGRPAVG